MKMQFGENPTIIDGMNKDACIQAGGIPSGCANAGYGPANICRCTFPPKASAGGQSQNINNVAVNVSPTIAAQVSPNISPVMNQAQTVKNVSTPAPAPVFTPEFTPANNAGNVARENYDDSRAMAVSAFLNSLRRAGKSLSIQELQNFNFCAYNTNQNLNNCLPARLFTATPAPVVSVALPPIVTTPPPIVAATPAPVVTATPAPIATSSPTIAPTPPQVEADTVDQAEVKKSEFTIPPMLIIGAVLLLLVR